MYEKMCVCVNNIIDVKYIGFFILKRTHKGQKVAKPICGKKIVTEPIQRF